MNQPTKLDVMKLDFKARLYRSCYRKEYTQTVENKLFNY